MINYLFFLQQAPNNYEDLGIKSILISSIIALGGVIIYLYKSKEKELAKKDNKIMEIINSHTKDLKEANHDMKTFVEKYHQFTIQLKEVIRGKL